MDDYLSKPATIEAIQTKLGQWLPLEQKAADVQSAALDDGRVIDWQVLSGYIGTDDAALLTEFFTEFLHHSTSTLAQIAQAVKAKDATLAGDLAHRMKSSARMVGANMFADTCVRLERAGLESQWSNIKHEQALLQENFIDVLAEAGAHGIVA
jgi:two-component system sensor histidine kinase/response regulator